MMILFQRGQVSSGLGRHKSLIVYHSQNKSHFIELETDIEIEIGKTHLNFFTLFCFDDTDGDGCHHHHHHQQQ